MARAYLLSHGCRVGGADDTFVPAGTTISFFSEFDENTLRLAGLAVLSNGDVQPTETLTGPCEVSNYYHTRFEDEAIAQHLATESSASGGRTYYVGSDIADQSWLCTTPTECRAAYPQHDPGCEGVFGKITEDEIYSVACRGLHGGAQTNTNDIDGSTDALTDNQAKAQEILDLGARDPGAAARYWESLTDATRQMIASSNTDVQTFFENYYAGGGDSDSAAVLEARRYLEAYDEETFYTWVSSLPPFERQRELIMADGPLAAAYAEGQRIDLARSLADGAQTDWENKAAATWVPSDSDLAEVAEVNKRTVKDAGDGQELDYELAGFVLLIGIGHAANWFDWARGEADHAAGTLTVEKGGVFSKGSFEVQGCPPAKQGVVEAAIERFSDKDVTFV